MIPIVLISQLLGCNTGDTNNGGSSSANLTPDAVVNVDLNGSVGDGPIIGATVAIYSDSGDLLSSVKSDVAASYKFKIKARGSDYPLLLKVTGGTDLVTGNEPDFQLSSVAMTPSEKSVNINPFSTLVVKMAQSMAGGVNAANISMTKSIVTGSFAFGLDPSVVADPITSQITESSVANMVKASEVLGEMVRRTRDSLHAAGTEVSGDAVMSAIAADLTDSILDGVGASGVNPAISATVKVVSAQVLVEALSNSLKVDGGPATGIIDDSIAYARPGVTSSQLTGSVRITSDMLNQTRVALSAAQVLDSGAAVQNIVSGVAGITPNASPAEVVTILPADASTGLGQAVTLAPYASTEDIAAINKIVDVAGDSGTTSGDTTSGGATSGDVSTGTAVSLQRTNWSIWYTDSEEVTGEDGAASNAIDGDPATIWHTQWSGGSPTYPHELQINLGGLYEITGLRYLPRQDGNDNGRISQYEIYVSNDGVNWGAAVASGTFPDTADEQQVLFVHVSAAYVRLVALGSYDGDPWASVAELNILGYVTSDNTTGAGSTGSGTPDPVTNSVPVISGIPVSSVVAGSVYSFEPTATDADGDTLTFSISNQPAWASFSSSTGRLSGTPFSDSVGSFDNIVISVSDTKGVVSLPAFSIQVKAAPIQTSSISLQWTAPVARTDGTPLSLADIDGYRIYYGTSANNYPNQLEVSDGTAQSATITDLPVGTYYIVMTTYDVIGLESAYSSMVTKTIP